MKDIKVVEPVRYKDRPFRMIAAVIVSAIVSAYGGGQSLLVLLVTPEFYAEFLTTLLFSLLLIEWIAWVTRRLDRRYDWKAFPLQRVGYQLLLGVVVPALAEFLMAAAYFKVYGINILATTFTSYAYPLILMLIILFNGYYFCYYGYLRLSHFENTAMTVLQKNGTNPQETVLVNKGSVTIAVSVEDICCIYREGNANFLLTFSGEKYFLSQTLDELEELVGEQNFFRANRRVILHRKAISHFESADYGKLTIYIKPALGGDHQVSVSQLKARPFREWLLQA